MVDIKKNIFILLAGYRDYMNRLASQMRVKKMTNQDLVETLRDGSKRDYIFCIFDCLYKQYITQALFFTINSGIGSICV